MNIRHLPLLLLCFSLLCACSDKAAKGNAQQKEESTNPVKLQEEIKSLEAELKSQDGKKMDKAKVAELIEKSQLFAKSFPKHETAPALLFRAADVARGTGNPSLGVQIWGTLMQAYPDYERTPDALFLTGFTYENNLNKKEEARKYYNKFLNDYPDHALFNQVKQTLDQIDKSPEELIKEFQRKNKANKD